MADETSKVLPDQAERRRQEPLWVKACPVCGRQMAKSTDYCHDYPKTVYCVPDSLHREVVAERDRLRAENEALKATVALWERRFDAWQNWRVFECSPASDDKSHGGRDAAER